MKIDPKKAYYPSVLDHKPGFFLSWILYTLFKHVRFSPDLAEYLRQMHREGTVVYAIKYRGILDYMLYHFRFRSGRLPYPKIAFNMNILAFMPVKQCFNVLKFYMSYLFKKGRFPNPFKTGFFRQSIEQGTCALLCLVDPKGFSRHFVHSEKDHIHFLLETQQGMEKPIFIVPQLMLYKRTPEKAHPNLKDMIFGYRDNPGVIKKVILFFRHNRRAFIDFGTPINLKKHLEMQPAGRSLEDATVEIKQQLIDSIDLQKRVILGPVMKNRQQLKEIVLKDQEVNKEIERKSLLSMQKRRQMRKQADKIFNEIAADYNINYIQFFYIALTWLFKKIYQGIEFDLRELSLVREWARKGSLIYVPSHKSHVDYLVLNYILFQNHMHTPRIAAGQNLTFWPMGHIFRKSGAFFIRRTFKGTSLYPKIFARYIKQLLLEGHPLEFFIEGGRSRSGKLILPKTGFLSILLNAYAEGYAEDLVFIPVSIGYDTILEQKSYLKELGGGEKKKESFRQMLTARHFLKRKHGKIYIRFGQPISLNTYLPNNKMLPDAAVQPLALDLTRSINKATLITPLALMAVAILSRHRRGFRVPLLIHTLNVFLNFFKHHRIALAPSLEDLETTVYETISFLLGKKVIAQMEESPQDEDTYFVNQEKISELEYHKNSVIHFLLSSSFVAASLLDGTEDEKTFKEVMDDYIFLRELFRYEFVYDTPEKNEQEISDVLRYFQDASYLITNTPTSGYKPSRLGYEELPAWAALSKTFLEAYWVAARTHLQTDVSAKKKSDHLKQISQMGLQYHRLGFIDHIEGVSRISFENASRVIREAISKQAADAPESETAEDCLRRLSQRIYALSHF